MKICNTCKESKNLDEFSKNKSKIDGLQVSCKECCRKQHRAYYANNKQHQIEVIGEAKKNRIKKLHLFKFDYLSKNPCIDCNEKNIIVLEFDHRENKEDNIATLIGQAVSLMRLKKEIEKCDVRCCNCHRIKTAKDFNWSVLEYLSKTVGL